MSVYAIRCLQNRLDYKIIIIITILLDKNTFQMSTWIMTNTITSSYIVADKRYYQSHTNTETHTHTLTHIQWYINIFVRI